MKFIQCNKRNYMRGRYCRMYGTRTDVYIVLHYTGMPKQTATGNAKYFQRKYVGSSAHFFVGTDGVVQSVDLNDTAWHCGVGYGQGKVTNDNSIGIELCCELDSKGEWYIPPKVLNQMYKLIKELKHSRTYNIIDVVRHYDCTGKICPEPLINNERWLRVKQAIYNL